MNRGYGRDFQDWEIAIATRFIGESLRQSGCSRDDDFDDLMQECLIEWHLKRGKYDPTRGASKQTFMARIVRNKLADIANKRKTKKRGAGRDHISLDDKVGGNEDSPHLIDTIASESSNASHFESPDEVLMKGAVSTVVAKLTERQQLIVRHLRESHSVSEIGRLINTPRTTVNDEIGRIRRLFHKEQLDSFLV